MDKSKRDDDRLKSSPLIDLTPHVLMVLVVTFLLIVVLAIVGPTTGNVFSNVAAKTLSR